MEIPVPPVFPPVLLFIALIQVAALPGAGAVLPEPFFPPPPPPPPPDEEALPDPDPDPNPLLLLPLTPPLSPFAFFLCCLPPPPPPLPLAPGPLPMPGQLSSGGGGGGGGGEGDAVAGARADARGVAGAAPFEAAAEGVFFFLADLAAAAAEVFALTDRLAARSTSISRRLPSSGRVAMRPSNSSLGRKRGRGGRG